MVKCGKTFSLARVVVPGRRLSVTVETQFTVTTTNVLSGYTVGGHSSGPTDGNTKEVSEIGHEKRVLPSRVD